jgi:hypothetical protein
MSDPRSFNPQWPPLHTLCHWRPDEKRLPIASPFARRQPRRTALRTPAVCLWHPAPGDGMEVL